jgi:hypothetical protein
MPIPAGAVAAGSVPLDAYDAEHVADLLAHAALVIGALAGEPGVEALNIELAPDADRSLTQLHTELACAQADLEEAIASHTGIMPA